jgi:hypothetical protein
MAMRRLISLTLAAMAVLLVSLGLRSLTPAHAQISAKPGVDLSGEWRYTGNRMSGVPVHILGVYTATAGGAVATSDVVALFDPTAKCDSAGSLSELFRGTAGQ